MLCSVAGTTTLDRECHYRGLSIDASKRVSVHVAEAFQRRLKCEKLTFCRPHQHAKYVCWWVCVDVSHENVCLYKSNLYEKI